MKKIAICLSGRIQTFDLIYPIYLELNSIYTDYHFDFFLTSWEYCRNELNYPDLFLQYSFYEDFKYTKYKRRDIFKRISFQTKMVNELRRNYENNNNFKYDLVIQTRPDVLIYPNTFSEIFNVLNNISPFTLYNDTGILVKNIFYMDKWLDLLFTGDIFTFGDSDTMYIASSLYDKVFIDNDTSITQLAHCGFAELLDRNNIFVKKIENLKYKIIRNKNESCLLKHISFAMPYEEAIYNLNKHNIIDNYKNFSSDFIETFQNLYEIELPKLI
jgi:hypothetical protein